MEVLPCVNVKDTTLIQKNIAKLVTFNENAKLTADAENDSTVNIKDATEIQNFAAGLLPAGTKVGKYV